MHNSDPIIIYQMGKVGSTAVKTSLENSHIKNPIYHVHFLSWKAINEVEKLYLHKLRMKTPDHVIKSKQLRKFIDNNYNKFNWKIITLVRDPVAREISDVFENLKREMPNLKINHDVETRKRVEEHIKKKLLNYDEFTDYTNCWFDQEIKDVFNYDIYSIPFKKFIGYQIYKNKNVDILLIRLEDLTNVFSVSLKEFIKEDNVTLIKNNSAANKNYRKLYSKVLENINIPKNVLDRIYSSKYSNHFYTKNEIKSLKSRWSSKKTERVFSVKEKFSSKTLKKILIIHPEGNINNNPNLTGIVEILCEKNFTVHIYSPKIEGIYQTTPCKNAKLILFEHKSNCVLDGHVLLFEHPAKVWQNIIQEVNDKLGPYDLVIGVDRGIIEAYNIAYYLCIPYGLISYEIMFQAETGAKFKEPEIVASQNLDFAVCQDKLRALKLSTENIIPIEKIIMLPLSGRFLKNGDKTNYIKEKLGIDYGKKIALMIGSVSEMSMVTQLIEDAKTWPDEWVLVLHNRYGFNNEIQKYMLKYQNQKNVFFSLTPVTSPNQLHRLLHSADLGIALYKSQPNNIYLGNNIHYIGMSSGKLSVYLQHGVPVLVNKIGEYSDYVKKFGLGVVIDHNQIIGMSASNDELEKWRINCCEFFKKNLDLNITIKPLINKIKELTYKQFKPRKNLYTIKTSYSKYKDKKTNIKHGDDNQKFLATAIVSTFNSERFLRECLEDLEKQTIAEKLEIIVVNSGSKENEEDIVKEYQKKYENIKYIKTDRRETVYAAWNRGIKSASGKYITNANTDDRHRKDALEVMVNIMETLPEIVMVYADVYITENENETFENCSPVACFRWMNWNRDDLLNKGCFMGPQPMWRRDIHLEYGYFDESFVTSGDYEFWLRISQNHNFLHIPVILGLYLRSAGSIEHTNRKRQAIENERILDMYRNAKKTGKIIRKNWHNDQDKKYLYEDSILMKEQQDIPRSLYTEIMTEFSNDRPEATIKKLEKMLKKYPDFALAHNDIGVLYFRHGDKKLALYHYRKTVNLQPENNTFRKNLADLLSVTFGEFEEALQHYVTVLASDPKDVEALSATGHICARLERFDDAAEFYEKVLEIEPNNSDAIHWLVKMREKESEIGLEGNLNERYQTLITEIDHEDFARTIQKIERFIEMNPKYGQAHNDLGVLYYKNESKAKVLACYLKAVELEPENVTFRKNLADFLYVEQGQVEEALENYVEVLRIKPDDLETLLITGHICTALKRYEDAMSFYNKVLNLEPQNLDARQNLEALKKRHISILHKEIRGEEKPDDDTENNQGEHHSSVDEVPIEQDKVVEELINKAEMLFQKERIEQAVDTMLKAISVNPSDGRVYVELAGQLVNHGRHKNALEVLAEMPTKQPEALAIQKLLVEGYAEEGIGNYAAAKKCSDDVLTRKPKDAKAMNLNGILAYRNGDKETAEQHFKRAIELDSKYGEPHTNLGTLVWETGDPKKAMEHYERGFFISPTDIDVANAYHEVVTANGEYERAEKVALKVLKKYPQCRKVRYLLVDTLIRQEKNGEALKELETALSTFGIDEGLLDTAIAFREQVGKIKITGSSKKPNVSLCMIVKDEEANLATCLASVKPIVDEIIVVDTGSTDRTKDIAEFFGARVYEFEWNDDFAEARNFSLSKAKGGWILIMDADEVISTKDYAKFRSIVRRRPKDSIAYSLMTRNYCTMANSVGWMPNDGKYHREEASVGWVPSVKVRLFYCKDRIWFEGVVHEMVEAVLKRKEIPIKQCHIPIHHYGRLNKDKLERKGEKYFEIGKKKLEKMGESINAIREMAVQAAAIEKNEEAIELWQRFLSLGPSPRLASEAFINLGTIYSRMGKFDDAFLVSKKALELTPEVKEAHNNFALSKFYLGNVEQAIPIFEKLLKKFPGYLSAQFKLAAAYCCNGQKEKGKKTFEILRKTIKMGHKEMALACHDLAKGFVSAQRIDYAIGLLNVSIENNYINDDLLNLFTECLNKKNGTRSVGKTVRRSVEIHSMCDISARPPG